jgi:anaerobic C4-dicarboxylate transporter
LGGWFLALPGAYASTMSLAVEIIVTVMAVLTAAFVLGLFVWAAKKDGEEDDAVQKRLGIRRRTWLGR